MRVIVGVDLPPYVTGDCSLRPAPNCSPESNATLATGVHPRDKLGGVPPDVIIRSSRGFVEFIFHFDDAVVVNTEPEPNPFDPDPPPFRVLEVICDRPGLE